MSAATPRYLKLGLLFVGLASVIAGAVYGLGGAKSFGLPHGSGRVDAVPASLEYRNDDGLSGYVEFRLQNEGTQPTRILSINSSCGCTMQEGDLPEFIAPGDDATLKLRVSPPSFGSKESLVKIQTDSAETPSVQVAVTLYGKKLTPPYMSRGPRETRIQFVAGEAPAPIKLRFTCVETFDEPWLTGIEAQPAIVSIDTPKIIDEQPLHEETVSREYEVLLHFDPESAANAPRTVSLIPITRTEPTKPSPDLSVTWQQVDAIRAAPVSLLFSFAANDAATEQTRRIVLVAADDDVEWTITSIASDADWLRAEAVESESQNHQLNVICAKPAGEREPHESATLRVVTDHPRCPEVRVRVNRTFRDEPRAESTGG